MDASKMLEVSAVLFTIAALGGIVMAIVRLGGKRNPPTWLAMAHGMLAAAGLTLLAYAACVFDVPMLAIYALILFVLAALGGVYLNLVFHWNRALLPAGILYAHAAISVVGYVLLLMAVLRPAVVVVTPVT